MVLKLILNNLKSFVDFLIYFSHGTIKANYYVSCTSENDCKTYTRTLYSFTVLTHLRNYVFIIYASTIDRHIVVMTDISPHAKRFKAFLFYFVVWDISLVQSQFEEEFTESVYDLCLPKIGGI